MADVLTFTPQPVRRIQPSAGGTFQPGHTALEVLQYDILDIEISVEFEAPGAGPIVVIGIVSSLQKETTDATFGTGAFTTSFTTSGPLFPPPPPQTLTFNGTFLRYARWYISASNWGTQTAVTFFIRGMGRKRNEL